MTQSLAIPRVIPNDWKRLDLIINKIKFRLGSAASPTFTGLTLTGLTASRLVWTDVNKALASKDLIDLIAGTANEIDITDDTNGGVIIGLINPLIVAKGGTGAATLTDHGILLGSGTGAITPLGVAANGQIPIGSAGADPVLAEITGTANQITSTPGAGTITLSLPQDIHTGASPTFAGLTIVNAINEFSTDGTMAGDSDNAVPTEKATKLYTDTLRSDLASINNAKGASLIGVEDSASLYTATNVETALAEVMDKVTPVTTTGNSITTPTGTVDAGDINSTTTIDDADSYDVSEVTGAPGFDIQITFTGIASGKEPNKVQLHIAYDGSTGHNIDLEMWNYTGTPQWDVVSADFLPDTGGVLAYYEIEIPGTVTDYVSGGEAKLRFNHTSAGNANHDVSIDFAALKHDLGSGAGVTEHGALSGLGDDDHLQYLLVDGTRALAGAWDMGSQALTNVNIDSGVITGITDLAIADGGTGASSAGGARTNLGLVIGTNVQAYDAGLLSLAGLTYSSTSFVKMTGANTFALDTTTYSASNHNHSGVYEPADAGLTSLAGLTYAAAAFVKMTGANTFALRTLQETSDDLEATIDHDNLLNFAANEHYLQSAITAVGTIGTGTWQATDVGIAYGGTGQSTAQLAINALSAVSGATNEHVLTKDTASGNATWKAAAGGGASTWIALTDTDPANFTGSAGKIVRVNSTPDGLEFFTIDDLAADGSPDSVADYVATYDASASAHKKVLMSNFPQGSGDEYIDRGDPAAWDFILTDLTTDNTWRDLDLSAIVPAGAIAVHLLLNIGDNVTASEIQFRKNGNANAHSAARIITQVANVGIRGDVIVSCDSNRIIEYKADNVSWSNIFILVKGWFLPAGTSNGKVKIDSGAIADYIGAANSDGVLRTGAGLSYTDGGNFVTLAVDGILEDLDTLGAPGSDGQFIVATGAGAFAYEATTVVRTSLGLGTGDSPTFAGLTLSGTLAAEGASVTVGKASTTTGTIILHDSNSANTITLTVPDISAGSLSFTLPPTDGDNTNVLQTDGNGVLTWVAAAGGGSGYLGYIKLSDVKSITTEGGTFTLGAWRTRVLNTEDADTNNDCTLSTNQITLAAGTYECLISCPAFAVVRHTTRLYNTTGAAVILMGTSEYSLDTPAQTRSFIVGRFTIAGSQALEVQHQCQATKTDTGFGVAADFTSEIYTIAEFWRVS